MVILTLLEESMVSIIYQVRLEGELLNSKKKDIDDAFNKIINESNYLLLGIISDVSLIDSRNTLSIICSEQLKTIPTKGLFY